MINHSLDLSLQKCIKDTGVSRSVVYSFFKEAGFNSFNEFIRVVHEEDVVENFNLKNLKNNLRDIVNLDIKQIDFLVNKMLKANKIMFYGKNKEISLLNNTIKYLRNKNKEIIFLNVWNRELVDNLIEELDTIDVFIVVDTEVRIRYFYDLCLLNANMPNMEYIRKCGFNKFYIGKNRDDDSYQLDFHIIKSPENVFNSKEINLLALDDYICSILRKG